MPSIPRIDQTYLTMICDAFVDLEDLLSDGEVGALLVGSGVEDIYPNSGKHSRLLNAFNNQQNRDDGADTVAVFLRRTGEHLKRRKGESAVENYREKINAILSYAGFALDESCSFIPFDANQPIYASADAQERAENLNKGVKSRHLHPDILLSTRPEFMVGTGYFRCVLEANNLLQEKLKAKTGLRIEGPAVAEHALAFSPERKPQLILNGFNSDKDYAEQFSLMCMLKALFLMFQDEQTKATRPAWEINFEDALDLLSLISFFHRKIEKGRRPN